MRAVPHCDTGNRAWSRPYIIHTNSPTNRASSALFTHDRAIGDITPVNTSPSTSRS